MSTKRMRLIAPTERDAEYFSRLKSAITEFPDVPLLNQLALASQFLGVLVALQDQRVVDVESAMDVVLVNMETGNASAVDSMFGDADTSRRN